jgi:hypothetical protein
VAAALAVTAVTGAAVGGAVLHGSGHDGEGRPTAVVRLGGAAPASVVTVPDSMPALLSTIPDNAAGESPSSPSGGRSGTGAESPAAPTLVPIAAPRGDTPVGSSVGTDESQHGADEQPIAGALPQGVAHYGVDPIAVSTDTLGRLDSYRTNELSGVLP